MSAKLKKLCIRYKYQLIVSVLFILIYGIYLIPVQSPPAEEVEAIVYVDSIDVCLGFDSVESKSIGCNHVFSEGVAQLTAFYYVGFESIPQKNLYIRWYRESELLQEGFNDFTQGGRKVDPGEYLLATQTIFELTPGEYRVDLYEDEIFLASAPFKVVR